jgi:Chlorophyllase enzyme
VLPIHVMLSTFAARIFVAIALLLVCDIAWGDCDRVPVPDVASWPPPPNSEKAPKAPQQIIDRTNREQFVNPDNDGASFCLYSPPSGAEAHGLILYLHGAEPLEVGAYDPMLQYLAKSGFYVVYPLVNLFRDEAHYPTLAKVALTDALAKLKSLRNVDIRKVAVAGHSHGGAAAVRVVASWTGPPAIQALILHDPSGNGGDKCFDSDNSAVCPREWDLSAEELITISCSTRLLIIQAYKSIGVDPMRYWRNLKQLARYRGTSGTMPQRNFLRVRDDESHWRQGIVLKSTHITPGVISPIACAVMTFDDAVDYNGCALTSMDEYGYWRPTRAAAYEAFYDKPIAPDYSPYCSSSDVTGTCAKTRDMGIWQDGVSATPMLNAAEIGELSTAFPDYCH